MGQKSLGPSASSGQATQASSHEQSSPVTDPWADPAGLQTVRLLDSKARVHVHVQQTQKVRQIWDIQPRVYHRFIENVWVVVSQRTRSKHHGFSRPRGHVERCPTRPLWRVAGGWPVPHLQTGRQDASRTFLWPMGTPQATMRGAQVVTASPGARPAQPSSNRPFGEEQMWGAVLQPCPQGVPEAWGGYMPGKGKGHLSPPRLVPTQGPQGETGH